MKRRGSALLTALFIMTLVAIAATAMTMRLQADIFRTRLLIAADKLYLASESVRFWAMNSLVEKPKQAVKSKLPGLIQIYPEQMVKGMVQSRLRGELYDMQAFININNFNDRKNLQQFVNLLKALAPGMAAKERDDLAWQLYYWLSPYTLGRGHDRTQALYTKEKPPYNPAHLLASSKSELRLIHGFDAKLTVLLLPQFTALPQQSKININTASKEVLMSLGEGLKPEEAEALIQARQNNGFEDKTKLRALLNKYKIPEAAICLESDFYMSIAYAESPELRLISVNYLKRVKSKKNNYSAFLIYEELNS